MADFGMPGAEDDGRGASQKLDVFVMIVMFEKQC